MLIVVKRIAESSGKVATRCLRTRIGRPCEVDDIQTGGDLRNFEFGMLPETLSFQRVPNQCHSLEAWNQGTSGGHKARKRNVNGPPSDRRRQGRQPIGFFWDSGENDWRFGLIVVTQAECKIESFRPYSNDRLNRNVAILIAQKVVQNRPIR